jgi:hypothetical protein
MKWFVLFLATIVFFKTSEAQVLEGKWYLFDKDERAELVELAFSKERIIAKQFTVDSLGRLHEKKGDEPPLTIKHIAPLDSGRLVYVVDIRSKRDTVYIPFEIRHHGRNDERVILIPLVDDKLPTIESALSMIDSIARRKSVLYSRSRIEEIVKMKRLGDITKETYILLLRHQAEIYKRLMDEKANKNSYDNRPQVENLFYEEMVSLGINPFTSRHYLSDVRRTMEKDPAVRDTVRRIEKELKGYKQ